MNPEQAKALDKWITTPPEEPEEEETVPIDFYGDVIKDDSCVVVIDCKSLTMANDKSSYHWQTYDVLAENLESFTQEIDPSDYRFVEIMTGEEWREQE